MSSVFAPADRFIDRHLETTPSTLVDLLTEVGVSSLDELIAQTVPSAIRLKQELRLPTALTETEVLALLKTIGQQNEIRTSLIGQGYYGTIVPNVILRNILENPGWYSQYTPYQAEIAQGRMEALINFQTMVSDLTGMELANASLLDEGTAAAEAMTMLQAISQRDGRGQCFFVDENTHPQTLAVLHSRAEPLGIELVVGNPEHFNFENPAVYGALLSYPGSDGTVVDYRGWVERAHATGIHVAVTSDLLALTLLVPPGEWGADVVVGSAQRFGVPMGYGGPHAAFFATRQEFARHIPGRIIGVSVDTQNRPAYRLTLQTREQHIRREKATSNICTAQVLLAVMSSMYAVYHGPKRLKSIARRIHALTTAFANGLKTLGYTLESNQYFDTLRIQLGDNGGIKRQVLQKLTDQARINLRYYEQDLSVGVSFDETTTPELILQLLDIFAETANRQSDVRTVAELEHLATSTLASVHLRTSDYLTHPVFNSYQTEHEMLRYIKRLESRDLSLVHSMIALGSCTMKLNATAEMIPVTWPEFGQIHPFAPVSQTQGYQQIFTELSQYLAEITGFPGVSLQPNSGAQGELAGLMTIRAFFKAQGQGHRHIALIPSSAHGTNPASAVMAGMKVVVVKCDNLGNVDLNDLTQKAVEHREHLAALMITYPSTHGVFEEQIQEICAIIHQNGGRVYMDGANMNAQVGLTNPANIGADVCHLNLHKTFCIPHGGGGPGMGPICCTAELAPYLPSHPEVTLHTTGYPIAAAPWGSASILLISYIYIRMMGPDGLTQATKQAILNANYLKTKLEREYPVLYQGNYGRVAHEMILDMRPFKHTANIEVEDIAKRLIDYGYHAPTVSFPVPGTMMIEPTESEAKAELDRFIEVMLSIRREIEAIATGQADKTDNVLKNAPHIATEIAATDWTHPYTREEAAYPIPGLRSFKFWAPVKRVNNSYGDRNLMCSCIPIAEYATETALA
jgi:glycine dehydrogenase